MSDDAPEDSAPADGPAPAPQPANPAQPERGRRFIRNAQSKLFFLAVLVLMLYLTWRVFHPFVIYMVTGLFVAVLALPIDRLWERVFPNRVAAFFTIFTIFIAITAPLAGLGYALYNDTIEVAQDIQDGKLAVWADEALVLAEPWLPDQTSEQRNETVNRIVDFVEERAGQALTSFGSKLLAGLGDFFLALVVILFVTYYVLTDGHRLVRFVQRATPLPDRQVTYLLKEAHRGLRAVFMGQILTSIIQASIAGIGFLIVGLPGVILWTALMAILALLPVVGAFLVWLPAGIYLLVVGQLWQGIFILVWGAIVVSNVDNFIRPILIGRSSGIHPLFVLIGVLGGVAAFGFIGLFLGPVLVGVTMSVLKVWEEEYLDPTVNDNSVEPSA